MDYLAHYLQKRRKNKNEGMPKMSKVLFVKAKYRPAEQAVSSKCMKHL